MGDLIQLKSFWYKKLKDKGFNDIENDKGYLKVWSQELNTDKVHPIWRASAEEYFRLAGQLLYEKRFIIGTDAIDKRIWKMHSNGFNSAKVAQRMGMNEKTVESRIRKLQKKFIKT